MSRLSFLSLFRSPLASQAQGHFVIGSMLSVVVIKDRSRVVAPHHTQHHAQMRVKPRYIVYVVEMQNAIHRLQICFTVCQLHTKAKTIHIRLFYAIATMLWFYTDTVSR